MGGLVCLKLFRCTEVGVFVTEKVVRDLASVLGGVIMGIFFFFFF